MPKFVIEGGHVLNGEVAISGSKNATLPILAATILATKPCVLKNVPDISDVHAFIDILRTLHIDVSFANGTVKIDPVKVRLNGIDQSLIKKMRASILLLGPMLARFKEVKLAFPGGCVLGKRSVHAHLHALTELGAKTIESSSHIHLKTKGLKGKKIIMAEASVTATENAIMAAVTAEGHTDIRCAAMEPHVQDLCSFLVKLGARIEGIGTPNLRIDGVRELGGASHNIIPDYLETGTLAIAAALSNGTVKLMNTDPNHLDSFWQHFEEIGVNFELGPDFVKINPHEKLKSLEKLQTSVYPGFPTDLQAPFSVLLTQCEGTSKVHETLFEGRLNYLPELERMGANVEILNPHQALIHGGRKLKAAKIISQDIRAGAAMVLAALVANGKTEISDIDYIDRGYEQIDEKLRSLGGRVERI